MSTLRILLITTIAIDINNGKHDDNDVSCDNGNYGNHGDDDEGEDFLDDNDDNHNDDGK